MDRARQVGLVALVFVLILVPLGAGSGPAPVLAADAAWPVSSFVVSEVQTGGASASDEFVEMANQGTSTVDLAGLESSTRRHPGRRSRGRRPGRHRPRSSPAAACSSRMPRDCSRRARTYVLERVRGDGRSDRLRVVGGEVIDAVGWGDATNGFVEGTPAPAPAAGSASSDCRVARPATRPIRT